MLLVQAGVVASPGRTAVLALLGAGVGLGLFLVFLGIVPRERGPSAGIAFTTWLRDRGWNRREVVARAGGTALAAVLLRQSPLWSRTTPITQSKRAPYCMMGVCFECLARIDGEASVQTCLTVVRDGMRVERQHGKRSLEA